MLIPARLHVLLAKESSQALIIRRGPSEKVAVVGWDRKTDKFTVGQWLKGRIYPYRSDISPDGKYWIYFAMGKYSHTWTAVAKAPYLKAIDFHSKQDAWNGGGLFLSNNTYWLNDGGGIAHKTERRGSLNITYEYPGLAVLQEECADIYPIRLKRDGWIMGNWEKLSYSDAQVYFTKPVNAHWQLIKIFHATLNHPIGKGVYYEEHKLVNIKSGEEISCPDWEWAEVINTPFYKKYDINHIVWAERGKMMKGQINKDTLSIAKELYDFNDMAFEELEAPY